MKKSLFNYHILNFFFYVNVSSLADPPRAKLSIGCLFAHPGQISRCTARSTHVRRFDSSKSSGGTGRIAHPLINSTRGMYLFQLIDLVLYIYIYIHTYIYIYIYIHIVAM